MEDFIQRWREHTPYTIQLPGLLGYVQNFPVLEGGRQLLAYPGFDSFAETTYESRDAMERAFGSPAREAAAQQRTSFADPNHYFWMTTLRRVMVNGQPGDGAVKLISFLHASPLATRDALLDSLSGPYAQLVAAGLPLRHEQYRVTPDNDDVPRGGRTTHFRCPPACDAIDMLWFRSPTEALAYANSELAFRAQRTLAGTVFGTERLIARPVIVVRPPDYD
jgi:hypothetical protein